MKSVIEKILYGFLFGIGLGAALFISLYFQNKLLKSEVEKSLYRFDPNTIEVSDHREITRNEKSIILGSAKNTGTSQASGVTVNVDLYQDGQFVKQCSDTINGTLAPGDSRNFEVACGGGCKNNPFVEHNKYKIYVTGF